MIVTNYTTTSSVIEAREKKIIVHPTVRSVPVFGPLSIAYLTVCVSVDLDPGMNLSLSEPM